MNIKTLVLLLLGSLATSSLVAQGFYVQLKGGFAVPIATENLFSPLPELGSGDFFMDEDGRISDKAVFGTLGRSYAAAVDMGYLFDEHFGVELGFLYTVGPDFTEAKRETPGFFAEQRSNTKGYAASLNLMVQGKTKLQPYAKFGIVAPLGGRIETAVTVTDSEEVTLCRLVPCAAGVSPFPNAELEVQIDAKAETRARAALGFQGSFGLRYPLNDNFAVFGEMTATALSLKTKETRYTEYKDTSSGNLTPNIMLPENSRDLDDLAEYDKAINYEDELTEKSNNAAYNNEYSTDLPLDERSLKSSSNNLSFMVGVRYAF